MSIWRIDLMTEVEIPDRDEVLNIKGIPRLKKKKLKICHKSGVKIFNYLT